MAEPVRRHCVRCMGASYRAAGSGEAPSRGCPECGGSGMVEITDPEEAAAFTAAIDAITEGIFRQAERSDAAYQKRWGRTK